MGVDIMKSNGTRCPPIFVVGVLILSLFLLCNWWSLSTQNSELLKQLDNLAEQLRINGDELGKCSQERQLLEEKLKESENRLVQQQIKMEQDKEAQEDVYQKTESELQESKKKVEENLKLCQVETESLKKLGEAKDQTSEALRTENKSLKYEIEQKDKEIKELEQQFKAVNKTCGLLEKSKLMQSLVKNYNASIKKSIPKPSNLKTDKETNNNNNINNINNNNNNNNNNKKEDAEQQLEDKFEGEGKNYGDSGLFSIDNDPREEEMKGS